MRSIRLGDLCRRFQVAYDCTPNELKSAYYQHCKIIHPDHSSVKSPNTAGFIRLREEYEVALKLRKLGYVGADRTQPLSYTDYTQQASGLGARSHWSAHLNQQQTADFASGGTRHSGQTTANTSCYQDDVIRVFDLETRVKGTFVLVFGTLFFLLALREFLVATAGSFWAYHTPSCSNNLVFRRYGHRIQAYGKNCPLARDCNPGQEETIPRSDFYERRLNKSGISREEKDRILRTQSRMIKPE